MLSSAPEAPCVTIQRHGALHSLLQTCKGGHNERLSVTVGICAMDFRSSVAFFSVLSLVLIGGSAARAQTIDPHTLYEQRCSGCHAPHAGDFARADLELADGKTVVRGTGRDLRSILARGHGKLSPRETDVMVAHLASILETGALFREKCFICHGRAVDLARSELVLRNGTLYGHYSGREIGTFLENHGRLSGPQIATAVEMLKGQLSSQTAD